MLCSAAQEVEVYLASSILDGPSMFFHLMGICLMGAFCRSLFLFKSRLEKNGQTSVSNLPKFSPMIPVGGADVACSFTFLLPGFCRHVVCSQFPIPQ